MLKAITDKVNIRKTQLKFKKTLYEALKKRKGIYTIGFQGGNIETDSLRSNEKIWYIYDEIGQDSTPRYWNAFGVSEKLNLNSSNPIVVEINIPLQGINRRVGGLFAINSATDNIVLLHRGKVGGGKKGVGKDAFLNWHNEKPVKVKYNNAQEKTDEVVFVADLSSRNFITQINEFVLSVAQFKIQVKRDEIASLSLDELKKKIGKAKKRIKKNVIETTTFERDPYVVEYVKRQAGGTCQLCKKMAPFHDSKGKPYLECHHIIWLSENGNDSVANAVALCPNCHKKMHIVNSSSDVVKLQKVARKYA